jgi:hypothetical protein
VVAPLGLSGATIEMAEPDELATIDWTPLLEKYFASTGEKAHCYAYLHKNS